MDPFSIIAAIIGAVAGIGTTIINATTQSSINSQNTAMAKQENDIMREREDNAVQRRANDLKLAGINPLLAGLGGASAQSGQLIPMQAPQINMPDFGEMYRDIMEGQNFKAQNKKIQSETALNQQQIKNLRASVKQIKETTSNIKQDTLLKLANTKIAEKDQMLKMAQIKIAQQQELEIKANTALAYQNADAIKRRVGIEAAESASRIRLNATQQKALLKGMESVQEDIKNKQKEGKLKDKELFYYSKKVMHEINMDKSKLDLEKKRSLFKGVMDTIRIGVETGAMIP